MKKLYEVSYYHPSIVSFNDDKGSIDTETNVLPIIGERVCIDGKYYIVDSIERTLGCCYEDGGEYFRVAVQKAKG